MNKGRITYRFTNGQREEVTSQPQRERVIPLHMDEFEVTEELLKDGTGGQPHYSSAAPIVSAPQLSVQQNDLVMDTGSLNQYTTDFGAWKSSFDQETDRVEAIIRESQKQNDPVTGYYSPPQPQHQQHQYQHQHQYQQPEPEPEPDNRQPLRDHRWYVPDEPVRYSRNGGPGSWLKIVASVAGAVITGVAFGFFVLSMFTTDSDPAKLQQNGVAAGTVTTPSAADKKDAAAGSAAAPDKAAAVNAGEAAGTVAAASAAVQIPAKTYTFLQSGVFSTQQGADTAGADLKRQGFAAAADAGEKFPVYAAMTLNRDDALLLGQQFASKKIEVIMKTVELPQVTKAKWTGKQPEQLQAYMANGDKLVQLIAGQSVKHLTESKSTPLDASSMDAVKTTHQAWAAMASAVNDGLSAEAKLAQQKMNSAMNTAVMSLDEYKKNPSAALMWQAQTSLMQYTLADKNLRLATAVQ